MRYSITLLAFLERWEKFLFEWLRCMAKLYIWPHHGTIPPQSQVCVFLPLLRGVRVIGRCTPTGNWAFSSHSFYNRSSKPFTPPQPQVCVFLPLLRGVRAIGRYIPTGNWAFSSHSFYNLSSKPFTPAQFEVISRGAYFNIATIIDFVAGS